MITMSAKYNLIKTSVIHLVMLSLTGWILVGENSVSPQFIKSAKSASRVPVADVASTKAQCNDGIDNDGDGLVDWINDLGCYNADDPTEGGLPSRSIENGWSVFEPAPDTRIIYVSSSEGDDANDGLSPETPKKTATAGAALLRLQMPDWLLFKRGDVWKDERSLWLKGGRSHEEPQVIASYGNSTVRPRFDMSTAFLRLITDLGTPLSHISIVGLHIKAYKKDINHLQFDGTTSTRIDWIAEGGDALFEDNKFEHAGIALKGRDILHGPTLSMTVRRNIFMNGYSTNSHAGHLYTAIRSHLIIEENLFYRGGWSDDFRFIVTPNQSVSAWKAISDGRFNIQLAGQQYPIDGINFKGANSISDVAGILENAINRAVGGGVSFDWRTSGVLKYKRDTFQPDLRHILNAYTGSVAGTDIHGTNFLDGDVSNWKGITDGRFNIRLSWSSYPVDGINFSRIASIEDVARVLEKAISTQTELTGTITWEYRGVLVLISNRFGTDFRYSITQYTGTAAGTDIHGASHLNGTSIGIPESTVFNRNMYLASGYGNTTLRRNIDADGASGGTQLRMGGVAEDNLFLRNPISLTYGQRENPANTTTSGVIRDNVILDSRNIDTQAQGTGIWVQSTLKGRDGPVYVRDLEIYNNIVAHNEHGTGNIKGISLQFGGGSRNIHVYDNIVYDWTNKKDISRGPSLYLNVNPGSKNITITNNDFQQPVGGFVAAVRTKSDFSGVSMSGNRYYSASADPKAWNIGWFEIGSAVSSADWFAASGETDSELRRVNYPDPNRNIGTYMASLGMTPTLETFIEEASKQSRFYWRNEYTAHAVNEYIRAGFGKTVSSGPVTKPNTSNNSQAAGNTSLQ